MLQLKGEKRRGRGAKDAAVKEGENAMARK
jgi:hypothetical protein